MEEESWEMNESRLEQLVFGLKASAGDDELLSSLKELADQAVRGTLHSDSAGRTH